jgi:glycosyltransferase involved in cell wall biosynthesis
MKKICYLGNNDPREKFRGVEEVIWRQAKVVKSPIYVYTSSKKEVHRYRGIICIGIPKIKYAKLICVIKKKGYRIHSHSYVGTVYACSLIDYMTVHDGLWYHKNLVEKNWWKYFYVLLEMYCNLLTKKMSYVSNFAKSKAISMGIRKRRHEIIYNTSKYENSTSSANKIKNQILIVRSIEERANIELIIQLALKKREFKFTIVGNGPCIDKYRKIVNQEGIENLIFEGYVPDEVLLKKYHESVLVIVPAKFGEGFGLPVIEAYSLNVCVIASNVCALPEVIIDKKFVFENDLISIVEKFEMAFSYVAENYYEFYKEKYSNDLFEKNTKFFYG